MTAATALMVAYRDIEATLATSSSRLAVSYDRLEVLRAAFLADISRRGPTRQSA